MCLSLPKKQRIKDFKPFRDRTKQSALRTACAVFVVEPSNNAFPRMGVTVSKRAVASAVTRVRVRRIVKESFRHHQNMLLGKDVIIIAKKGIDTLSNEALRRFMDEQWRAVASKIS